MTELKILRLKKPLSFEQEAKLYHLMGTPFKTEKDQNLETERNNTLCSNRENLLAAIQLLTEIYPECFSPQHPKPLRIGILNDIYSQGRWPHSKRFLRKTLAFYTGSSLYQRALLVETHRVAITGKVIDTVTEQQKMAAEARLQKLQEKKLAKKPKKQQSKINNKEASDH